MSHNNSSTNTRMSPRDVTRKYAVEIVVEHAQSGTIIQLEVIIFPQI
jgi:hypothetical protein